MNLKPMVILFSFLIVGSAFVYGENVWNYLTVPRADQLYCALGDCGGGAGGGELGTQHDQPLNMTSNVTHHSVNVTWLNVTMNATIGNLTVIDQFTTPNDRWGEQETVLTQTANTIFFCTEPGEIIGVKIGTRTGYGDFLNNIKCAME